MQHERSSCQTETGHLEMNSCTSCGRCLRALPGAAAPPRTPMMQHQQYPSVVALFIRYQSIWFRSSFCIVPGSVEWGFASNSLTGKFPFAPYSIGYKAQLGLLFYAHSTTTSKDSLIASTLYNRYSHSHDFSGGKVLKPVLWVYVADVILHTSCMAMVIRISVGYYFIRFLNITL